MVLSHYGIIRSARRAKKNLCLVRYADCRIFFLAHVGVRGRKDIRCPFGCRQLNQRRQNNKRTAEYHKSSEGKQKRRNRYAAKKLSQASKDSCEGFKNPERTAKPAVAVHASSPTPKGVVSDLPSPDPKRTTPNDAPISMPYGWSRLTPMLQTLMFMEPNHGGTSFHHIQPALPARFIIANVVVGKRIVTPQAALLHFAAFDQFLDLRGHGSG